MLLAVAKSFSSSFDWLFSPVEGSVSVREVEKRWKKVPITQPKSGRDENIIAACLIFIAYMLCGRYNQTPIRLTVSSLEMWWIGDVRMMNL